MKLKQISSWNSYQSVMLQITNDEIKSWLLEEGPITKRIKSNKEFRLKLIQDEVSAVEESEKQFINYNSTNIRVREVLLFGDEIPMVFARTIIPNSTIEEGLADLGTLGNKPLGDILFEKDVFLRGDVLYASFMNEDKLFWGRKRKYSVKGYPFSVMEVFLITQSNE